MVGAIRPVGSREVYRSPWLTLREDDIRYADGSSGTYAVVEKRDFTVVVPYTGDGFWLVQQYRYPVGRRAWEFPQGGWPDGHDGTAADLAAAELREETGLRAEHLEHLGRLDSAPGYAANAFDVFLATGLVAGEPQREATEADMVHAHVREDELYAMIETGEFRDSNSLAALLLLRLRTAERG
jgi:8-oxo-dGTP pyrophosphatase MutT (NUDIX family)